MDPGKHWNSVYTRKTAETVSWFQPHADLSLRLIKAAGTSLTANIIDIGAGASVLVDELLAAGYQQLTVLDLSTTALQVAQVRLGAKAAQVNWIVGDVGSVRLPAAHFDLWHDRAVFHFMLSRDARAAYKDTLLRALKPGGHLIMATFAEDGPEQCSGLPVVRYSVAALVAEMGPDFSLLHSEKELHTSPSGATQRFIYCHFRRTGASHSLLGGTAATPQHDS